MDSLPIHFFFEQNQIIIWRYKTISELMINEQIKDKEVRLIGPDGEQLGIVSSREALKGNKVKVTLRFRGREMAHMNSSKHILDDIAKELEEVAVVEKAPKVEGRSVSMVLAEKK